MSSTPKQQREPVTDLLVLSALDRGERHRPHPAPGVPIWVILEHLDTARRSKRSREIRAVLEELVSGGAVRHARRRSVSFWIITEKGAARLRRARRGGKAPVLPESPQHRLWREAQEIAEQEMSDLRQSLTGRLRQGLQMLGRPESGVRSDAWFVLGAELERAVWMVGSASHCLREWQEPSEEQADRDDGCDPGDEQLTSSERKRLRVLRTGRRNFRRWHDLPDDRDIRSSGHSL